MKNSDANKIIKPKFHSHVEDRYFICLYIVFMWCKLPVFQYTIHSTNRITGTDYDIFLDLSMENGVSALYMPTGPFYVRLACVKIYETVKLWPIYTDFSHSAPASLFCSAAAAWSWSSGMLPDDWLRNSSSAILSTSDCSLTRSRVVVYVQFCLASLHWPDADHFKALSHFRPRR